MAFDVNFGRSALAEGYNVHAGFLEDVVCWYLFTGSVNVEHDRRTGVAVS